MVITPLVINMKFAPLDSAHTELSKLNISQEGLPILHVYWLHSKTHFELLDVFSCGTAYLNGEGIVPC